MPASPSTASRLSRLSATCAAMSPAWWGLPSPPIAVCPAQYRVRVCPETISPWLNPNSADHVHGLTAVRSIAISAPSIESVLGEPRSRYTTSCVVYRWHDLSYAGRPVGLAGAAAAPARSAVRRHAGPRTGGVHPHRAA